MPKSPDHIEIIARALITKEGSVLCCQALKGGYFFLPGGHVDPGEPAAEACKREIQEELNLSAQIGNCRLIAEERFEQGGKARHEINLVFHVEHLSRQPRNPSPDSSPSTDQAETVIAKDTEIKSAEAHIGFEWIKFTDLPTTDLRPTAIRDRIPDAIAGIQLQFITG